MRLCHASFVNFSLMIDLMTFSKIAHCMLDATYLLSHRGLNILNIEESRKTSNPPSTD